VTAATRARHCCKAIGRGLSGGIPESSRPQVGGLLHLVSMGIRGACRDAVSSFAGSSGRRVVAAGGDSRAAARRGVFPRRLSGFSLLERPPRAVVDGEGSEQFFPRRRVGGGRIRDRFVGPTPSGMPEIPPAWRPNGRFFSAGSHGGFDSIAGNAKIRGRWVTQQKREQDGSDRRRQRPHSDIAPSSAG
jgi:hypothetical protein